MNAFLPRCTAFFALAVLAASGQEETPSPSLETPEATGLTIATRTPEERIAFLLEVAQVYFNEKDYSSAIGAYERILEIDPGHEEARYVVAHVYINAKQYPKAETALKSLIEDAPDDFKLKNNLAWLYATADDPAFRNGRKAIELAQEAMVLAPNDHHVWSTLAEAYYVSGEYEKASRAVLQMAALAARYGTDITEESVGEYNEQIRKCQRALEADKALRGESDPAASVGEKSE